MAVPGKEAGFDQLSSPAWANTRKKKTPPFFVQNPFSVLHLGSRACFTCPSHPVCSFPGTEAQPAARPTHLALSKLNLTQPSCRSSSSLPPCQSPARGCAYIPATQHGPLGLVERGQGQAFSAPALRSYWSPRSVCSRCWGGGGVTGTRLLSAWVQPGRRHHSFLGQPHAGLGVALKR